MQSVSWTGLPTLPVLLELHCIMPRGEMIYSGHIIISDQELK